MSRLKFGVIGINHGHINGMTRTVEQGGGELRAFYAPEDDLAAAFAARFPHAQRVTDKRGILEDPEISLVLSAAITSDRAPIGIEVMRHGKDFLSDKAGFVRLEDVKEARRASLETGQRFFIYFGERVGSKATLRAGELVQSGAIGRVVHTMGLGPHKLSAEGRPPWFFRKEQYGGILTDIASHQADQFLFFTGAVEASVASAHVANLSNPQYPELEDYGDVSFRGTTANGEPVFGQVRVDWYTPKGLGVWGDGRLFILGTEGTIEIRKVIDVAGRGPGSHLFLFDGKETRYIDCEDLDNPFGRQIVEDVLNRTEIALPQEHCFRASELILQAQQMAEKQS
jgi:predicted dehydrogenase